MFRPLSYDVHISEHGHLGTSCGMQVTGKVVEAGWGCEECSLWNNELITLLTSGGEKRKGVQRPGSPVGLSLRPLPPALSVLWVELPSGGGDRYLHHLVWSEELMFRCQSFCWVAQASSSFLGPCCGVLVQIPSNPCDY